MAAVTAAVAVGVGTAYAANRQGAAAKKGAAAQGNAAQAAMGKFDDVYNQSRDDASGWLTTGQQANSRLQALGNGDFSSFYTDPGYQFRSDQGLQGLSRMAAARGNYRGGGTDADIINFNQGLASQEYDNFWNRNFNLSNQGLNTAQYLGNLGQNYAHNWANARGVKGQADAQRAMAGPMTQAGYGNALASAFGTYAGMGGGGGGFGGASGGGGLTGMFGGMFGGTGKTGQNNKVGIVDWNKGGWGG
jgi:hypothetical protein